MTPIPFISVWAASVFYLTKTIVRGEVVVVVVPNGVQPQDGHVFPKMSEAKAWLKDNGFTQRGN